MHNIIYIVLVSLSMGIPYPDIDISINDNPYQQDIFIHSTGGENQFLAILDPDLDVKWYIVSVDDKGWDFKVNNNDQLTYFRKPTNGWTPSGGGIWHVMNHAMMEIDTLTCVNGFSADYHDIQYPQSGGYILQAYGRKEIDLPQTEVIDSANILILQEFDQNHNLIFEWDNSDHMDIQDYADHMNLNSTYRNWMHGNSLEIDLDENIIVSNRTMSELIKFHRQTGELIWRLGGPMNDFIFINDPHSGPNRQHDARRLENGNIMIFDNGDGREPPLTRVSEYEIDEDEMIATLVWEYSHPSGYISLNQGSAQRLENGNTLISWGGVSDHGQIITEVDYNQNIVLEFEYPAINHSYKVRKNDWQFNVNLIVGDLNLDEDINIFDIIFIVNFILSDEYAHPFHLFKGDLDKSGEINIQDIILLLDLVLS